jgi:hypothetical protein
MATSHAPPTDLKVEQLPNAEITLDTVQETATAVASDAATAWVPPCNQYLVTDTATGEITRTPGTYTASDFYVEPADGPPELYRFRLEADGWYGIPVNDPARVAQQRAYIEAYDLRPARDIDVDEWGGTDA